ncbi:ABC transporter ATP-binding protein [Candidatus Woesearchaeota archaeon]|nr:ABC transporter ATP-binding protein [Candidatus Woesearchaeota archaeon]
MAIIEVSGVSKRFRDAAGRGFYAVNDASLSINEGEIFAILGPNGAGKSTLVNMMLGLLLPDKGTISVMGERAGNQEVMEKIGYASGDERFHWSLTCGDILGFAGMAYTVNNRARRIGELLDFFGLRGVRDSKFDALSTGEKAKLALAYSLVADPRILFLDEPTLGLDPDISIKVRKEIKAIRERRGATIVLTSHYMREVEYLADRVAFINRGRIMEVSSVAGIRKHYPDLENYFVEMVKG